jgi:hypothetical protein
MIEIGIGVFFAVLFVTAYLLVSKLLRSGDNGQSRWRELSSHPLRGSKRIETKPSRLFLTTGEMGEHHSKPKGTQGR